VTEKHLADVAHAVVNQVALLVLGRRTLSGAIKLGVQLDAKDVQATQMMEERDAERLLGGSEMDDARVVVGKEGRPFGMTGLALGIVVNRVLERHVNGIKRFDGPLSRVVIAHVT
jgi:hypothetical protein